MAAQEALGGVAWDMASDMQTWPHIMLAHPHGADSSTEPLFLLCQWQSARLCDLQAEAATAAWPPGERLVDMAWYKAGALAVLAAPAAAAAEPPRSPTGGSAAGDGGEAARLLLLPWAAAPMRRLELRPGMPPALQEVCTSCLSSNLQPGKPLRDVQQCCLAAAVAMGRGRHAHSAWSCGRACGVGSGHLLTRPPTCVYLEKLLPEESLAGSWRGSRGSPCSVWGTCQPACACAH